MRPKAYRRHIQRNSGSTQPFFQPAAARSDRSSQGSFFAAAPNPIQTKLTVNHPGDTHEREADAVSDQVMRMRQGDAPILQRMPLTPVNNIMRKCSACEEKEKEGVQRKENGSGDASGNAAPSIVSNVLTSGGGQPMDGSTRQFMESRFGQDFSQVRIHTDARAAESASAIQARAYTSGRDVVFGNGEYQPESEGGRRLLAHELVHVGQQMGIAENFIQKQEAETTQPAGSGSGSSASGAQAAKEDLAIQLIDDSGGISRDEARVRAPNRLRVRNLADLVSQLSKYGKPIGKLYIITHSNTTASLEFHDGTKITTEDMDAVSKALNGNVKNAPDEIVLLGCAMGGATTKMDNLKKSTGAKATSGTNCWTFTTRSTPFTYTPPGGSSRPVTTRGNLPEALINQGVKTMMDGLTSNDGKQVKDCILGLLPGEAADAKFDKVKDLYFKNQGLLVAGWASPNYNYDWQSDSICEKDMTASTPCKKIVR